jgi:hypothetical protein
MEHVNVYHTYKITLTVSQTTKHLEKHIPEQFTIAPGHFYSRTVDLTYDKTIKLVNNNKSFVLHILRKFQIGKAYISM